MKTTVLIHDDWEIYGDGSGDIEDLMFRPARDVLRACGEFGAKYTFFAEIGQQLAMKKSPVESHRRAAASWEKILTEAVAAGHDAQLHLHTQWLGARLQADQFELDYSKWSLGRLGAEEMRMALVEARDYLASLLKPHAPDYEVVAFRAGGYMAQPSHTILSVLRDLKIRADFSVIKGLKMENDSLGKIDFSEAPSAVRPWFPSSDDVAKEEPAYRDIFCAPVFSYSTHFPVPIFSALINPLSVGFSLKKRSFDKTRDFSPIYFQKTGSRAEAGESAGGILSRIFKKRTLVCDFGQMPYTTILKMVDLFEEQAQKLGDVAVALVLYTHSKQIFSVENIRTLFRHLNRRGNIEYKTTREWVRRTHAAFLKNSPAPAVV
jgi:hypothetical protein